MKKASQQTPEQRFKSQVAAPDSNGCQLWKATAFSNGYGQFSVDGKQVYAHRQAYAYANKIPLSSIPTDSYVLHSTTCKSRLCCAPSHLRLGTAKENALDRIACGRSGLGSKLTRRPFTADEKALLAKLHAEGSSQYRIAQVLKRAETVIAYQLKKNNLTVATKLRKRAAGITAAVTELSKAITDLYGEPEHKIAA